jgi:hypothetical protein
VRESRVRIESSILFSFELMLPEGEGPANRSDFSRERSRRAFTPAVILFIALPESEDNIEPG